MSPSQSNDHPHTKAGPCPPPLKINKDSHLIKKSSPSSSSSSSSMAVKPQQHRHPVIIYTHSPKVIHTHPRDFMALVQKLTGLSRSDDDAPAQQAQRKAEKPDAPEDHQKNVKDENESPPSAMSDENCSITGAENIVGDGNSTCFLPPIYENHHPFLGNLPLFAPNSSDFLCQNHPFYNYSDSLIYTTPSIRSSASTFDGLNEFRDF